LPVGLGVDPPRRLALEYWFRAALLVRLERVALPTNIEVGTVARVQSALGVIECEPKNSIK
jgi:hypothetical protein